MLKPYKRIFKENYFSQEIEIYTKDYKKIIMLAKKFNLDIDRHAPINKEMESFWLNGDKNNYIKFTKLLIKNNIYFNEV